ncbi:hypothetical protein, partial [Stieleria mannarensis]|uniref:hypothetical protein n=1 Tax=Stieleria mannarensis TaxID=2755585 RepID=UPI001C728F54
YFGKLFGRSSETHVEGGSQLDLFDLGDDVNDAPHQPSDDCDFVINHIDCRGPGYLLGGTT